MDGVRLGGWLLGCIIMKNVGREINAAEPRWMETIYGSGLGFGCFSRGGVEWVGGRVEIA